jgi:hypothetical protein
MAGKPLFAKTNPGGRARVQVESGASLAGTTTKNNTSCDTEKEVWSLKKGRIKSNDHPRNFRKRME